MSFLDFRKDFKKKKFYFREKNLKLKKLSFCKVK